MARPWEEALTSLVLDADPTAALDAAGGDRTRWELIRSMARARLVRACREALPQLTRVLGEPALAARVYAWLASGKPHARYFRKIGEEFGQELDRTDLDERAIRALELDLAVLEVRDRAVDDPLPSPAFELGAPLRVTPVSRVVASVDNAAACALVWRSCIDGRAHWREVPAWYVAWLEFLDGQRTGAAALPLALAETRTAPDTALLEAFSSHTAALVERGAFANIAAD